MPSPSPVVPPVPSPSHSDVGIIKTRHVSFAKNERWIQPVGDDDGDDYKSPRHGILKSPALRSHDHNDALGELLCDVGFKSVYKCSARTIIDSIPIWLLMRPCDETRVREIANLKKDCPYFPGVISVFKTHGVKAPSLRMPQSIAIFDGQVCVMMMMIDVLASCQCVRYDNSREK